MEKSISTLVIDRHSFRKLAAMTSNKKLRLVYFRMMARYAKRELSA